MLHLKQILFTLLVLSALICTVSCCIARKSSEIVVAAPESVVLLKAPIGQMSFTDLQPMVRIAKGKRMVIKSNYDLQGKKLVLDNGYTLDFQGGSFSNGHIQGNDTRIRHQGNPIFNKVGICGTWNVTEITTDMFKDLNYENSLADVLALTNPNLENKVVIKDVDYDYPVKVSSIGIFEAPLKLNSNTDLQLDGNIRIMPTNLFQYRIVVLKDCKAVKIHGRGTIWGDRPTHDYSIDEAHKGWKSHEWGHGIKISNSENVEISGISVNDCTGDSFNIGENSKNIVLNGVTANGSRRQGVTIAVASNVRIKNSHFLNIGKENGTAPGAAVDIEPDNTDCEIKDIIVEKSDINDCNNGVISYSMGFGNTWTEYKDGKRVVKHDNRHYVNILVKNCTISGTQNALSLTGWDRGEILDCEVFDSYFFLRTPKNMTVIGNNINCKYLFPNNKLVKNCQILKNRINVEERSDVVLKGSEFKENVLSKLSRLNIKQVQ